ncbi:MAG: tetratricopeptide repeat protein [Elusimicrobia bacterium]|nr:tetratricopeptide repeat protein [Elusimicrobiota bacterium]
MAAAATLASLSLHWIYLFNAGGLWRDEAMTVRVATLPAFHDSFRNLAHISLPALLPLLIRVWANLFGDGDQCLRLLGALLGSGLLAVLWLNARLFRLRSPALSVTLVGLNIVVLCFGDSLRGYGLGSMLMLALLPLLWRLAREPSLRNFAWATCGAVLSVQTLYTNVALLAAGCLAGLAVGLRRRDPRACLAVSAAGFVGVLSLLPYRSLIMGRADVLAPHVYHNRFADVAQQAWLVLGSSSPRMSWVWAGWIVLALSAAAFTLARGSAAEERRDLALFGTTALAGGSGAVVLFLMVSGAPVTMWHLVPWITFVAACLDVLVACGGEGTGLKPLKIAAIAALVAWMLPSLRVSAHYRQTTADLAASRLSAAARREDLVIVSPWVFGVSFDRYYKGDAPWTTIPPLAEHAIQRQDLLREQMAAPAETDPVLKRVRETLASGHRVWWVGILSNPTMTSAAFPPPTLRASLAEYNAFLGAWEANVAGPMFAHAARAVRVPVFSGVVNPKEDFGLVFFEGWRHHTDKDLWTALLVEQAQEILQAAPDSPDAHHNLGMALLKVGSAAEAVGEFEKALQLNPRYSEAHSDLAAALGGVGRNDEALAHLKEALRLNPDNAQAHYNLGLRYHQTGRIAEAIAQYQETLRIKPDDPDAHNNLGVALLSVGRTAEAVDQERQALRANPNYPYAHYNMGLALQSLGKTADAMEQFEQALRLKPDYVEAQFGVGACLDALNRPTEALARYQAALRLNPGFAPARERVGRRQRAPAPGR